MISDRIIISRLFDKSATVLCFYCASTLLRLTMRGNVYFDNQAKKLINDGITIASGKLLSVSERSMYRIQKSSYMGDRFVLELNEASGQTHETVWKETESVLREMKKHSLSRSDEDVVLTNILEMLQSLKSTFPSHLRNAVNYQLPYGMDAIEHKIYPAYTVTKTNKWLDPLFTFDPKKKYSIVEQLPLFKAYILYCDRRGILDL